MKKSIAIFSLVFIILLSSISSCFAASDYPSVSTLLEGEYNAYIIYKISDGKVIARVVSSDSEDFIKKVYFEYKDGNLSISTSNTSTVEVKQYLSDGQKWSLISTSNVAGSGGYQTYESITNATIYESSKDVYYSNDWNQVFFPLTLPEAGLLEATLGMMETETPEVGTKVVTQMRTILLCGVGCLALLITLPLLARVLRRFLAR